jgi:hypothetical protein
VGCVPAEPTSVSSGHGKVTKRFVTNKRNLADRSREAGPSSVPMNPGGSILRADVGPICAPITKLARNSGLPSSALIEVGMDHRLADQEPLKAMLRAKRQ